MPHLIDAFDDYNDFSRTRYYIICFNRLPSSISFETAFKENKESMGLVIASLDFEIHKLTEVFKHWNTEDDKDSDSSKDFPYQYLLKSTEKDLLIWLSLSNNELHVEFLYDATDLNLEREVISLNKTLRDEFGTIKAPTFKVLTYNSKYFDTEDVKSEFLQVNINDNYNDDFHEINTIIENALGQEKSGLILLHGAPGTGKTSYIKHLLSKFHENSFIFVQNEFVKDLLNPDFISFLLKNRNAILVIEDAEKVITTRESISENSVASTILQLTDGLFSDYLNIKIICTFNTNIERVDKALLRKGRLIANYEFKPLTAEKSNKLLQALGFSSKEAEMSLADIFNFEEKSFDTASPKKKIGF
ncbi:AAA family ATPase [Rufibacter immobilis]|uniref:AAA family ATPase n=1 Tax=Rufibacter immobilis TaxID=1348778 RepID=A0A3M9MYE6_9BACT|nr:AAA family ATPase [Rufibacter immobilis]RNI29788.1 AAA family ATPase [Rufibacter immobilis]